MLVAASFSGYENGHHHSWSLEIADCRATAIANWNPEFRGRKTILADFEMKQEEFLLLLEPFATLQSRYPCPLDGSSIRSISVEIDGDMLISTVHGAPSRTEHPELALFYSIWRVVERRIRSEIEIACAAK